MKLTDEEYFGSYIAESNTIQCPDCGDRIKVDLDRKWSASLYLCYPCTRRRQTEINNKMDRES